MNRMFLRVRALMCALYGEKYEQQLAPVHTYINTVCTRCSYLHTHRAHDTDHILHMPDIRTPLQCKRDLRSSRGYAALIGSYLPKFRDNLSVQYSKAKLDPGRRDR